VVENFCYERRGCIYDGRRAGDGILGSSGNSLSSILKKGSEEGEVERHAAKPRLIFTLPHRNYIG